MTSPFCALADRYDELWDGTPAGRRQREQVWREIEDLFHPGDRVLDLGCGTGTDALYLHTGGVEVFGIDASRAMVAITREHGIPAATLGIEELYIVRGTFDGAISNFGALNCVRDLHRVSMDLARLVKPGGPVALCFLSRFWWRETVSSLLRFEFKKACRRWFGVVRWRGLEIRYPSGRTIRACFENDFEYVRSVAIGGGDHRLYIMRRRFEC